MATDFSKYHTATSLIEECNLVGDANRIVWLQQTKEEAAINIAAMHILCKAALSNDISHKKVAKDKTDEYYESVGATLHVFAKAQARAELGLSHGDVTRLFKCKRQIFHTCHL